jgi:hypothetical protein
MLHIVPPQQDELTLPIEIVNINDPKPRLPRASALAGKGRAPPGDPAQ